MGAGVFVKSAGDFRHANAYPLVDDLIAVGSRDHRDPRRFLGGPGNQLPVLRGSRRQRGAHGDPSVAHPLERHRLALLVEQRHWPGVQLRPRPEVHDLIRVGDPEILVQRKGRQLLGRLRHHRAADQQQKQAAHILHWFAPHQDPF